MCVRVPVPPLFVFVDAGRFLSIFCIYCTKASKMLGFHYAHCKLCVQLIGQRIECSPHADDATAHAWLWFQEVTNAVCVREEMG